MLNRRQTLAFAGAAVAFPFVARAQSGFPTRTITMVVAYPAGGPTDVIARIVAATIEEDLKQKVIVENRAGAAGSIGTRAVAQAGVDLMLSGGLSRVVGVGNRAMVFSNRFAPRTMVASISKRLLRPLDPTHQAS